MLTSTESISNIEVICSIVARKLSVNAISKVNINNLIILSSWEHIVTSVVLRCLTDSISSPARTSRLLDFSDFVPLVLCVAPHIRKWSLTFLENLDEAIRLAPYLALNLSIEVRNLAHIDLLAATLSSSLALFFVFYEFSRVPILSKCIPRERPNILILRPHYDVAILIVRHGPHRLWQLDSLLAGAI